MRDQRPRRHQATRTTRTALDHEGHKLLGSNYGQLRRNTDQRSRHPCLATIVLIVGRLIVGRLIDWRNRWNHVP